MLPEHAEALHPSCAHLLLPVVREQRGMMYGSWAGMGDGWELSYGARLGDSHPIGAGIDWLELSRPSRFVSGQQPALCPLGAPVERELLSRSGKLWVSQWWPTNVPPSQTQDPPL